VIERSFDAPPLRKHLVVNAPARRRTQARAPTQNCDPLTSGFAWCTQPVHNRSRPIRVALYDLPRQVERKGAGGSPVPDQRMATQAGG
jgi:hypothetical protein